MKRGGFVVKNTSAWSYEQIEPYLPFIAQAFLKMAQRFPEDFCAQQVWQSILQGERLLWLIFKGREPYAFLTTKTTLTVTQKKRLLLLELAGRGGGELTQILPQIEHWAKTQDIAQIQAVGRMGWRKAMQQAGFTPEIITFEKDLEDGRQNARYNQYHNE